MSEVPKHMNDVFYEDLNAIGDDVELTDVFINRDGETIMKRCYTGLTSDGRAFTFDVELKYNERWGQERADTSKALQQYLDACDKGATCVLVENI